MPCCQLSLHCSSILTHSHTCICAHPTPSLYSSPPPPPLQLLAGTAIGGRSVGSQIKKEDGSLLSRSIQLPDVPFYIRYSQPSLQGRFTPVSVQVGRDLDSYELSSSFVNRVTQAEASVQDETGRHRLAYSLAWRNPFVTRSTTDVFATTASPQ